MQACSDENLGELTKKFVVPEALHDLTDGDHVLPYYCTEELCNVKAPVEEVIATKAKLTEMLAANPKKPEGAGGNNEETGEAEAEKGEANVGGTGGAAQTTVAVATIAFSMAMARLAL